MSMWPASLRKPRLQPSEEEEEEDEFAGVILDRSHTLLPMLRKFIGTVLVVMVIMIVLSSLGVDIGPLIAGAGVIGIAIGFGARKLVSDVISGFFFLMDDAFRVGEYIKPAASREPWRPPPCATPSYATIWERSRSWPTVIWEPSTTICGAAWWSK
jgi:hypothetical protein